MDVLHRARQGFQPLSVPDEVKEAALGHLERWLAPDREAWHPQIRSLVDRERFDALLDAFWRVLPFGTGGRRGPVGVGPNRFNPVTLGTSVQGHAVWLRERFPRERLEVVVGWDVRTFHDLGEVYDPTLPDPVRGWSSRDFAELAARIYAAHGIRVHLLPRESARYLSTPELSFTIRALGAHGGLMVSASHNPPDDNGAKVYDRHGGQEIPPDDEVLAARVDQVDEVDLIAWEEAVDAGRIVPLQDAVHDAYVARAAAGAGGASRSARVVFSALHGTGRWSAGEALSRAGFDVIEVEDQGTADGRFPTVPFRAPNPEVPRALDRAVARAEAVGADLVLATDPDADRVGAVVRHAGGWRFLTGNAIAALLTEHRLTARSFPFRPLVIRTEVTSALVSRIAEAHGAEVIDDLLVGFKYVGALLRDADRSRRFVLGVEESHGALLTAVIRDKDAAGAAVALAEAASAAKDRGRTLVDLLHALGERHGFFAQRLAGLVFRGATGQERIRRALRSFRAEPPDTVGPRRVRSFSDRQDPAGPLGPLRSETDRAARDVLSFALEGDARVVLRPSGTEPKAKAYVEVVASSAEEAEAGARELIADFTDLFLARVGLALPRWAHAIADLVPVDEKVRIAAEVVPELRHRLARGEAVEPWLTDALAPLGPDPRALLAEAVRALGDPAVEGALSGGPQDLRR